MSDSHLQRIHLIETELSRLKSEIQPRTNSLFSAAKAVATVLVTYWVLWAVLAALILNASYGLGFFEDFEKKGITKKSSEYYQKLGDKMMERAEFKAADEAYAYALKIDPNNIKATHGQMKVQVLQPVPGDKAYNPLVVGARLEYLRDVFERDRKDLREAYVLPYWQGVMLRDQGDVAEAKKCFAESMRRNPDFLGSYLALGFTHFLDGDINEAINNLSAAIRKDPNSAPALNSLGFGYIVLANHAAADHLTKAHLELAIFLLKRSNEIIERPHTKLNLGDAFRYSKKYRAALVAHLNALDMVKNTKAEEGIYNQFELTYVFLPTSPNDNESVKIFLPLDTKDKLTINILYALSLDYALRGDYGLADKHFDEAHKLDRRGVFSSLTANKITTVLNLVKPEGQALEWLVRQRGRLLKDILR